MLCKLLAALFMFPTVEVEIIDHGDPIIDQQWLMLLGDINPKRNHEVLTSIAPESFWLDIETAATG